MNEWDRLRRAAAMNKERYPPGTRIELIHMGEDDPNPIPDGNYLGYYPRLIMGSLSQTRLLVRKRDCDRAMEKLRDFAAYARGFEEAMGKSGYLSYTSPVLDHWGESAEGLGRLSGSVDFGNYVRQSLSHPDLNPLRERDDFKALRAELEEGTSCGSSTSRE